MRKYRLFSQFIAINLAGFGFLFLAYLNGWWGQVIAADSSRVSLIILALFLVALASAGYRILSISSDLDHIAGGEAGSWQRLRPNPNAGTDAARALEIRLFSRIHHIRTIGNCMVVLGLIGTVIGFILVASNVDASSAADVEQVGSLVGALLHGMGVAFYTTLVGAVFSLWISMNYQILHTGTATLVADLLVVAEPDHRECVS